MVNYKLLGLVLLITAGVIHSGLQISTGTIYIPSNQDFGTLDDIKQVEELYVFFGTIFLVLGLFGTVAEAAAGGSGLLSMPFGLAASALRGLGITSGPPWVRTFDLTPVEDDTAPRRVAVDVTWAVPRTEDRVDEIFIRKKAADRSSWFSSVTSWFSRFGSTGSTLVSVIRSSDPAFSTGRYRDKDVEANEDYTYYIQCVNREGRSVDRYANVRTLPSPRAGIPPGDPYEGLSAVANWAAPARGSVAEFWFVDERSGSYVMRPIPSGSTSVQYVAGERMIMLIRTGIGNDGVPQVFATPAGRTSADYVEIRVSGGTLAINPHVSMNMYRPPGAVPRASGWIVFETIAPAWMGPGVSIDVIPHIEVL